MAEKIKIAELAIDNKKLLKELQDTKKGIDALTATQKDLKKAGDTSSKTFIQNEADLKKLKSEYNAQIKVLQTTTGANDKLNDALNKNIQSVDEAKKNNAELVQLRNQLNASTTEGANAIAEINKRLDENNAKINTASSSLEKQFQNIGNYPEQLDKVSGGLGGVVKGFASATKASLAFIATPIGALLALVAGAFALVKNAMNRSEESTNKIAKAFSSFKGITDALLKFLEPLGEFLIDGLVKGFELVEKGVFKALDAIAKGLDFLGFDEQAKSLRGFTDEVALGVKNANDLADAEADLAKAQRFSQKVQLDAQKEAEKLRQIRDDESLSIQERIRANEQLGVVLQQQLQDELAIANKALEVARLRILADGESKEALDAQAEALTTIADIQERITGQESEQLVNLTSLRKEASEKAREFADKQIQKQEELLDKFIAEQGFRSKTLEEQLKIDEQVAEKRKAILEAELKNRNITQEEFDTELLNIQNELGLARANIVVENAKEELDAYIQNNMSKLESDEYFSEEALRIEKERLEAVAEQRREYERIRFEEGVINQNEYNEAINEINEENRVALEEAESEREEARKEAEAIDLENKLLIDEQRFQDDFARESARLEQMRQKEIEVAEATGADTTLINAKYNKFQEENERAKFNAKLAGAGTVFNGIADLLGKESAVGKAAAVASAIINTAQGVTKALAEGGVIGIATGALVGAVGAVNIAKIVSAKPPARPQTTIPKAEKGMLLSGARHSQGGIHIEAEDGEAIINRESTARYLPLLSAINQSGGGVPFMARGGIAGSVSSPSSSLIDIDAFAEAVANQPAPVVSVEEISDVSNRVNVIESQSVL